MLVIDNQLCYSPEPPRNYALWNDGIPNGIAVCAVDRATGCHLIQSRGIRTDVIQGLPPWNLYYLLYPECDLLPGAYRTWPEGSARLSKLKTPKVETLLEIMEFAFDAYDWLLEPPLKFMQRVGRLGLPAHFDFAAVMHRAEAIDDMTPRFSGNVATVRNWRRS